MPRFGYGLLLALLLIQPTAAAQDVLQDGPAREITFEEALQIALRQNTDLRRAENAVQARGEAVDFARASFLPNLSASLTPAQRYGLAFDQTTGRLEQETSEALSASASLGINVFNGFSDVATLRQRRLEREVGRLDLERAEQNVLFTVGNEFLQTLLDAELVTIRREALGAQEQQLAQVEQLVEGGVRARADLFQQAALVAEAELALLQAESQLELARTRLVGTLQLDPFEAYAFTAPDLEAVALTPAAYDLEALLTAAYDRRVDLAAQERAIAAADASVQAAKGGYYPRVDLFASYGSSYSSLASRPIDGTGTVTPVTTASGDPVFIGGEPFVIPGSPEFEEAPFGSQFFTDNRGGSVGLSIDIPIFDRFATRAQVRQARLARENARIALEDLEQDVALEVRQAYLDYRNAEKRLDVTARQVEAAEVALAAEQERYALGVSTLTERAQAQARLVEARSARAQAVAQFVFQRTLLDYAVGTLDADTVPFE